jgi:serine/threonine-protein kinase
MGKVLRVEDSDLNRQVAMKVLLGAKGNDRALRFIEEAQISSQLQHPSVLPVHDFGIDGNGDFFFTMQLIEGSESLRDVIDRLQQGDSDTFQRYSLERRVQIVQRVCHALHYAHERGVIHRDVKPANIVVGAHGEVWLVDWGVASLGCADRQRTISPVTLGTTAEGVASAVPEEQGAWVGTPRYMAPEQIMGLSEEVDAVTDVYSLVAVLYELLTLRHYLGDRGASVSTLIEAIPHDTPRDAEDWTHPLNGRVPRPLSRICRKGLTKLRGTRYQSALELERDLQAWIEGNSPIVCPGTAIQRGLRRYSALIDARPGLVPALTIAGGILFAAWVAYASALAVLR